MVSQAVREEVLDVSGCCPISQSPRYLLLIMELVLWLVAFDAIPA